VYCAALADFSRRFTLIHADEIFSDLAFTCPGAAVDPRLSAAIMV
jgi:hypothetical protein